MAFTNFWNQKCKTNPLLKEPNTVMKITSKSFQKELEKAYNQGFLSGFVDEGTENDPRPPSTFAGIFGSGGIFDKIFGGYKYQ